MKTKHHPPFPAITRAKLLISLTNYHSTITNTTHPDILETAYHRVVDELKEITEPLQEKQSLAIEKTLENAAFLAYRGSSVKLMHEWVISQLIENVFEGHEPEFVD